jgi:hypothetical protein
MGAFWVLILTQSQSLPKKMIAVSMINHLLVAREIMGDRNVKVCLLNSQYRRLGTAELSSFIMILWQLFANHRRWAGYSGQWCPGGFGQEILRRSLDPHSVCTQVV